MFWMLIFSIKYKPFVNKEHNNLEYFSSLSAVALLFAAYLYILEANIIVKAICFIMIHLTNILFSMPWIFGVLKIMIMKYYQGLAKIFPKTIAVILAIEKTINDIIEENIFNPTKIIKIAISNFKSFNLKKTKKRRKMSFNMELDKIN